MGSARPLPGLLARQLRRSLVDGVTKLLSLDGPEVWLPIRVFVADPEQLTLDLDLALLQLLRIDFEKVIARVHSVLYLEFRGDLPTATARLQRLETALECVLLDLCGLDPLFVVDAAAEGGTARLLLDARLDTLDKLPVLRGDL